MVLLECALSMMCLVMFVSMMSGWFLGRCMMFRMAVVMEKSCGCSVCEVMCVSSCQVCSACGQ